MLRVVPGSSNICRALLSGLALVAVGCSEEPPERETLRPVRSEVVAVSRGSRVRAFSGTARAGQETNLSFRVPGRIEGLFVKVGDTVEAGQLIAQLERRDYEIAEQQARANLNQAEARSRNASADLERIRGLYENDNTSKNELDAALAQQQAARAEVEGGRQALESTSRRLSYTSLTAPVNGAIAWVPVEVNENVLQGQTSVRMTSGERPEVEVGVPGVLISQIHEGDAVTVTLDALPGTELDAVVTEVGVAATGTATTFPVTARLSRPSQEVRSGMAATVAFRFDAGEGESIYLPPHAVGGDGRGRFVFLLEPSGEEGVGLVRRTPVEIGEFTREGLMIRSGVSVGQRVVTAGVRRLTDRQRVKLLDSPGNAR